MKDARNPVKAVQNTARILDEIRRNEGARVKTLEERLDLTKGAIHNHLATLQESGYVVKESEEYQLGLRFLDIAHHARNRFKILDIVGDQVDRLAEESGELVLFTVEENHKGVCLYKAEGKNAVQTDLYVGYRNDLHHTAVGKAILAFLPKAKRREIIENGDLAQITDATITEEQQLYEELEEIRERGLAYNHGESIQGLVGVGAPVRDQEGGVLGAISVIGPTSRLNEQQLEEEFPQPLMQTVNVIEINATSL